jgi:hypothetical protein
VFTPLNWEVGGGRGGRGSGGVKSKRVKEVRKKMIGNLEESNSISMVKSHKNHKY